MGLAIYLLGKPRVERGNSVVPAPRGQKVWALLGYLLRSEKAVSRVKLADLLFADAEDPQAALRWNLSELRKLLGVQGLTGDMLRLEQEASNYSQLQDNVRKLQQVGGNSPKP